MAGRHGWLRAPLGALSLLVALALSACQTTRAPVDEGFRRFEAQSAALFAARQAGHITWSEWAEGTNRNLAALYGRSTPDLVAHQARIRHIAADVDSGRITANEGNRQVVHAARIIRTAPRPR